MLAVAYSLVTALCNALSVVLASMGMKGSNPNSANFYMAVSQAVVLTALLVRDLPSLSPTALLYFALSGACANFLARLLNFISVKQSGVANTSAIVGSSPLISTLMAIMLLGEPLKTSVIAGSGLVFLGIFLISGSQGRGVIRSQVLLVPLLSASFYAAANILRKMGMNVQPHSVLGAQSSSVSGLVLFIVYVLVSGKGGELACSRRSLWFYVAAGIVGSVGWVSIMNAMSHGSVSVVGTVVYSYPLFSLALSWFLLRGEEVITVRTTLGCVSVVAGVALVSLLG